jgi:hypothetical protein
VANVHSQLIAARGDQARSRLELVRALGVPLETPVALSASLHQIAMSDVVPNEAEAVSVALKERPDLAAADRALGRLVIEFPGSTLIDQALYERARIAYQQRAWPAARRHLEQLAAIRATPLAEPGQYLRCRIAVETREASAAACFVAYRKQFPRAPHDVDALGFLAQHAHASGGCAAAVGYVDELARTYPRMAITATWRTRCPGGAR